MAPGVPFAFMAGVQLLSVAAALGLAGAACFPRLRRRTTPVFVLGALLIGIADILTAVRYGPDVSDRIAWLRAAGTLLVAIGLATGVLRPPTAWRLPAAAAETAAVGAVVVPLGAAPAPAIASAVTAGLAALASLRSRHEQPLEAWLLAAAFACLGVAGGLAVAARTSGTAGIALLSARGAWALLVFAVLARLARASVLAKVVVAILAGVLAMAIGAVAVGSVVAGVVSSQQSDQSSRIALAQAAALGSGGGPATLGNDLVSSAGSFANVAALCPANAARCGRVLGEFGALPNAFAAFVSQGQRVRFATGADKLSPAAKIELASTPIVRQALAGGPNGGNAASLATLGGQLVVLGVAPRRPSNTSPTAPPPSVAVYGGVIDRSYDATQQLATTFDVTILVGGHVASSSLSDTDAGVVASVGRASGATTGTLIDRRSPLVRAARGHLPTVAFTQISASDGTPIAVLGVSQAAHTALAAQKRAFTELFLVALGVMLLSAVAALLLGRRIVEPVQRLTVVARRVRRGDLSATADVTSQDEVGTLARAFDAMTSSVSQLTDDLRASAEQEADLRTRLETVLASMSDGVVALDSGGTVTSINRAACELAGVVDGETVGRDVTTVLDVRDGVGELVPLTSPTRLPLEATVQTADGVGVPVLVDVAPLAGAVDEVDGFVIVLRDQTRDREVERMKTEFLSNVSHELRTPLTPIRGYAELLRRGSDLPTQQVVYVDTILESTLRMSRVVDLLVDVAAIEAGRVRADVRPVALGSFFDERLERWRVRYPDRAGDLRRRVSRGLPAISIDPEWVAKALDEFVDNAVKYTPGGTPISLLATQGEEGRVRLAVRDVGPGIDPAATELFSDFVQADGSETRRVGGLGLGLSFVRRLADAFNLGLEVRSELGRGAEFSLDVPVAPPKDVAAPRRRGPRTKRPGARRPAARPASVRRRRPPADPPEPS